MSIDIHTVISYRANRSDFNGNESISDLSVGVFYSETSASKFVAEFLKKDHEVRNKDYYYSWEYTYLLNGEPGNVEFGDYIHPSREDDLRLDEDWDRKCNIEDTWSRILKEAHRIFRDERAMLEEQERKRAEETAAQKEKDRVARRKAKYEALKKEFGE